MAILRVAPWLLLWAGLCAASPTRPGAHRVHGAHPKTPVPPHQGLLLDQQAGADYRVDDAAYVADYPDDLRDYDYQVTATAPDDSEGEEYPDADVVPHAGSPPPPPTPSTPHPLSAAVTRKPPRYQGGTLYDDYVAQCAGLISGSSGMRAQPFYPLLAALVGALAAAYLLQ